MIVNQWHSEMMNQPLVPTLRPSASAPALGVDSSSPRAIDFPIIGSFGAYDFLNYLCSFLGVKNFSINSVPYKDLETFQLTLFLSLFIAFSLLGMAMQTLQPSWDLETFHLTVILPGT